MAKNEPSSKSSSPLKKLLKFVLVAGGIFVGLVVILLVAAAIIIPIKFPPSKLKAMAEEKLTGSLHHKVTVGDVRFSVLSGFAISNLKIANRAGWDPRPMVLAKDISISYDLFPLLWGEVSLGEVKLNQPDILLERRGLNQFSFSDMMGTDEVQAAPAPAPVKAAPKTKAKPKPKKKAKKHVALIAPVERPAFSSFFVDSAWAGPAPAADSSSGPIKNITIKSVRILHGKLVYLDETTSPAQESDLKDMNLVVKNVSLTGGKTTFSLETPLNYNKMAYNLGLEGKFRYFQSSQSLKEVDVKGKVNEVGFHISGDALNMTTDFAPDMDGEMSLTALEALGVLPKSMARMPEGLSLTGPAKVDFHLSGTIKTGLKLKGTADGTELVVKYKDNFAKTNKTNCKVDFSSVRSQDGSFDVPSYKLVYQDWEVTGNFHYPNNHPWSAEAHSKNLPFKGLSGMVPRLSKTTIDGVGSMDLAFTQASGMALPFKINGKVQLNGVGITLPQEPYLQDVTGPILFEGTVARVPTVNFKSFDGAGSTGVTVHFDKEPLSYSYAFSLKNVNAQKAVDASIDAFVTNATMMSLKGKIFGTMNLVYSGAGKGTSSAQMMPSQVGSGSYNIVGAKIKGVPIIKTINGFLKDNSDEMGFERIDGVLGMKSSVITYTANTNGKVGAIREKGGINVAVTPMVYSPDMEIQADIKKDYVNSDAIKTAIGPELAGLIKNVDFLADDNGNVPVDLKFTGVVSENHYSWDRTRIGAVVQKHVGAEIQKAAAPVVQDLGKKAGDALKGLFGK